MAFFDDLGKRASKTTARAMAKAQEISEISKINTSISEEEKKVNAAYYQIGKLYVSLHGEEGLYTLGGSDAGSVVSATGGAWRW